MSCNGAGMLVLGVTSARTKNKEEWRQNLVNLHRRRTTGATSSIGVRRPKWLKARLFLWLCLNWNSNTPAKMKIPTPCFLCCSKPCLLDLTSEVQWILCVSGINIMQESSLSCLDREHTILLFTKISTNVQCAMCCKLYGYLKEMVLYDLLCMVSSFEASKLWQQLKLGVLCPAIRNY